jgi:hypothetical protein
MNTATTQPTCVKGGKEQDYVQGGVTSTNHRCEAYLLNNWDVDITNVTLKHTSGDNVDTLSIGRLTKGAQSDRFQIQFVTGLFAHHDYWWIEFTAVGGNEAGTWTCKDNFYCDLRSSDDGTVVQIQVSAGDTNMYVTESSGQCYVSLHHP